MLKYNERSPKEMSVITKAKDLMEHTCTLTANTNRFPKKYRFSIGARIENLAIDIYENLVRANECNLSDAHERQRRLDCQQEVIVSCKLLNTMIELSHKNTVYRTEYRLGGILEQACRRGKENDCRVAQQRQAAAEQSIKHIGYALFLLTRRTRTTSATSIRTAR